MTSAVSLMAQWFYAQMLCSLAVWLYWSCSLDSAFGPRSAADRAIQSA
jgi:hypothetical protein